MNIIKLFLYKTNKINQIQYLILFVYNFSVYNNVHSIIFIIYLALKIDQMNCKNVPLNKAQNSNYFENIYVYIKYNYFLFKNNYYL